MRKTIISILTLLALVLILSACTPHAPTPLPIITPGAVDLVASNAKPGDTAVIDWRFDPDHILLIKGLCTSEPPCPPSNLALQDLTSHEISDLNVPAEGFLISDAAQGKNQQAAYFYNQNLYFYDVKTGKKIRIGKGYTPSFSSDGSRIAFIDWEQPTAPHLSTYSIRNQKIEKSFSLLLNTDPSKSLDIEAIVWKPGDQSVYITDHWTDKDTNGVYQSQIDEINLDTGEQKSVYKSIWIEDFSMSPDGRNFAILENNRSNEQSSTLKIVNIADQCLVGQYNFPVYSSIVRWSPTGESILVDFISGLNPYLVNVKNVFGSTYQDLKCKQ